MLFSVSGKHWKFSTNQYAALKPPGSFFCKTQNNTFLKLYIAQQTCNLSTMKVGGMGIRKSSPALAMEDVQGQPDLHENLSQENIKQKCKNTFLLCSNIDISHSDMKTLPPLQDFHVSIRILTNYHAWWISLSVLKTAFHKTSTPNLPGYFKFHKFPNIISSF